MIVKNTYNEVVKGVSPLSTITLPPFIENVQDETTDQKDARISIYNEMKDSYLNNWFVEVLTEEKPDLEIHKIDEEKLKTAIEKIVWKQTLSQEEMIKVYQENWLDDDVYIETE